MRDAVAGSMNHESGGLASPESMEANARHCAHCNSPGSCFSGALLDVSGRETCVMACAIPNCCDNSSKSASTT